MRLLQRYILCDLLRLFVFLTVVLTLLLMVIGVTRDAISLGLGPAQIMRIVPFVAPSMLPFTIPATFLLTVCVVYGRLASDLEIVAAKAAGINILALLNPAFLLAALLVVTCFLTTNRVMPWATQRIEIALVEAMEEMFLNVLATQQHIRSPGDQYSITVAGVDGQRLLRPTFVYNHNQYRLVVVAAEASMRFDSENDEAVVILKDASVSTPDATGQHSWLRRYEARLPLPAIRRGLKEQNMTVDQMEAVRRENKAELAAVRRARDVRIALGLTMGNFQVVEHEAITSRPTVRHLERINRKLQTQYHLRYALAASPLMFTLLGAPVAILREKREFMSNFMFCFIPILLTYYPIFLLTLNLSKNGTVEPWWSMWLANAAILIPGIMWLRKVLRH